MSYSTRQVCSRKFLFIFCTVAVMVDLFQPVILFECPIRTVSDNLETFLVLTFYNSFMWMFKLAPCRYWALAVPTYIVVTVALALAFYIGLNFLSTPPPTSLNTLFGKPYIVFLAVCSTT